MGQDGLFGIVRSPRQETSRSQLPSVPYPTFNLLYQPSAWPGRRRPENSFHVHRVKKICFKLFADFIGCLGWRFPLLLLLPKQPGLQILAVWKKKGLQEDVPELF